MGQINCQCQEVLLQHQTTGKGRNSYTLTFSPQKPQEQHFTRIGLSNSYTSINIVLSEQGMSFGTSADCQQRLNSVPGNSFKIMARMASRSLMVKDGGVGLGVFVLRKKIFVNKTAETFLSINDHFMMLSLGISGKINCKAIDISGQQNITVDLQKEQQVKLGELRLLLKSQKGGQEISVRRQDRRGMFMLLTDEQRIKTHQILRLGCQFFQVESIKSYSDPPVGDYKSIRNSTK